VDFALYIRILWRFRLLVLLGLTLALTLALLSFVRVGGDGVTYRQTELWASTTRLLVTQKGFPEGRLYGQTPTLGDEPVAPVVDPGRFNNLAVLYSQLAVSDPVRMLMRRDGPIRGRVIVNPVVGGGEFRIQLPMIDMMAIATSPTGAMELAARSAAALQTYIAEQQRASDVPLADRAVMVPVVRPVRAELFQPRSKTMSIVVFLAVMFITVATAFLLENLRPSAVGETGATIRDELEAPRATQRRTA
jgi:hypothetical protein